MDRIETWILAGIIGLIIAKKRHEKITFNNVFGWGMLTLFILGLIITVIEWLVGV